MADHPLPRGGRPARHLGAAGRVVSRRHGPAHTVNVEESSARFATIAEAIAAGSEQLHLCIDGDRPSPPLTAMASLR